MRLLIAVLLLLAGCSKSEPIRQWDPRVLYWNNNDLSCTKLDNGGIDGTSIQKELNFCRPGRGITIALKRSL